MNNQTDRSIWIILLVSIAAAVAYIVLVFLPQQSAIGKMREELKTKQAYVERMAQAGPMIRATQDKLAAADEYDAVWNERTASGSDLAGLFGQISAVAKKTKIITTRFDPEPVTPCGDLQRIPLAMGCRGSFAQIHEFLADLEHLPATIWIRELNLERSSKGGKDIQAELNLVIFADNPGNSDQVDHSE